MQRALAAMLLMAGAAAGSERILVHGHRGARAVLPENTIPAFEHAIEAGADVLELDLHVTKDDALVVWHDPRIDGRAIRDMTLAEVKTIDVGSRGSRGFPKQKLLPGTRIPTLDEVLALASRGSFEFNIETKVTGDPPPDRFAELVLAAIRRHGLEKRVIVQSFDFRTLHAMKRLAPEIRLAALDEKGGRDFVAVAAEAGARIVAPHYRLVTPEKVRDAHAAGLQVIPWTANTPEVWGKLIAAGVDAIITDDPAALIAYLKTR